MSALSRQGTAFGALLEILVSCTPSNPILIADSAELSVRKIYFDHIL